LKNYINDPSAGSPTETLLRLLLPPNHQVWSTLTERPQNASVLQCLSPKISLSNSSVVATGGVYKDQGRIQCKLVTHTY